MAKSQPVMFIYINHRLGLTKTDMSNLFDMVIYDALDRNFTKLPREWKVVFDENLGSKLFKMVPHDLIEALMHVIIPTNPTESELERLTAYLSYNESYDLTTKEATVVRKWFIDNLTVQAKELTAEIEARNKREQAEEERYALSQAEKYIKVLTKAGYQVVHPAAKAVADKKAKATKAKSKKAK